MFGRIKNIDIFGRNVIIVFIGTSLASLLNLLYQLFLAHRLRPSDFASFNALLSIFMLCSSPLSTLQLAVAKYCAEFRALNQINKIKILLSGLLKKVLPYCLLSYFVIYFTSFYLLAKLKIHSRFSGVILGALVASAWIMPILLGGMQGLEMFGGQAAIAVGMGMLKLVLAFLFILWGYAGGGPLGAVLGAVLFGICALCFALRKYISLKPMRDTINFKEIFLYLFPVAISSFCFIALVSMDLVLVKLYFNSTLTGAYSLAQMVGKVFLFLPGAIGMVMFPRVSGLKAKNIDTALTLKRSLLYGAWLCLIGGLVYNFFPTVVLKFLTGKAIPESITLGRLFCLSMSVFALLYILITYLLSLGDLRFIKYLGIFTILQVLAVVFLHKTLIQVQVILCINSILLFCIHLFLVKSSART